MGMLERKEENSVPKEALKWKLVRRSLPGKPRKRCSGEEDIRVMGIRSWMRMAM